MAAFLTKRARLVVIVWVVLVGLLATVGRNLDHELTLHPPFIDGTQSKRAHDIATREFGTEYPIVVMLRGPQAAVERQGKSLANRLEKVPGMLVVSPWSRGATLAGLRPAPGVAALIARGESIDGDELTGLLPPVERGIDETVKGPVRASVAGLPATIESLIGASSGGRKIGESIALPVLLLVLLLVFRSVLAALMPVIVGGAVVAATRGILSLLLGVLELDLFVTSVVGMMGLALGVDYSLLVVSRFREERKHLEAAEAAQATLRATARSILPAGCALLLAMLAAAQVLPGVASSSVAIAIAVVTVLSMVSALCVVPALLTIFGGNLDRWTLPRRAASGAVPFRRWRRLAGSPRAVAAIMIALLFFAGWAFTLKSASATIAFLPVGDSGRLQQEEVERGLGPGWTAPMEVVMNGRGSPVTSQERLSALSAFQRTVERDPGVQTMAGFAEVEKSTSHLGSIEHSLAAGEHGLDRLGVGISRVRKGAVLNTSGLLAAAEGARQLDSGAGAAGEGAGLLADSLQAASSGSEQLALGLSRANDGSGRLAQGTTKASAGAERLASALDRAREKTGEIKGGARLLENAMHSGEDRLAELHSPLRSTGEKLSQAWQALQRMTAGRGDPEYAAVAQAVEEANRSLTGTDLRTGEPAEPSSPGVESGVERAEGQFGVGLYLSSKLDKSGRQAQEGIGKLARGSRRLDRGLRRLAAGGRRVSDGIAALSQGGEALSPAVRQLSEGAERLAVGLGQLEDGTGHLAEGLGGGAQKSKLLTGALRRIGAGLEHGQNSNEGSPLSRLRNLSPGLFRSSYFVLAGLDGAKPLRRRQLGFLVNLDRGGQYARMLVIPRDDPTSAGAQETVVRLEGDAAGLGRRTGTEVVVGGVAPAQIDSNTAARGDAISLRLALSLISFLVLIPVMRSLTVPLLAALLNLLTVSASFGVLALLFDGSLLGGPGYVDATVINATIVVMFGLAIDYEVFVFARIREEFVRTGSTKAAVRGGLDHTGHVVTGAAVIMIAIFLAFSVSTFMTLRNFGIAQAIGVSIDAFVVRLILVPAMIGRLGKWTWWMPRWLDRLLPGASLAPAGQPREEPSGA